MRSLIGGVTFVKPVSVTTGVFFTTPYLYRVALRQMSSDTVPPVELMLRTKISSALSPSVLEVVNESYKHSVPKGSETHFKVMMADTFRLHEVCKHFSAALGAGASRIFGVRRQVADRATSNGPKLHHKHLHLTTTVTCSEYLC